MDELTKQLQELAQSMPTVVQFNEQYDVLVDQQSIMIPMDTILWLEEVIARHKAHSKLELEAIGRRTVEENHPSMVNQFNWGYFE